MIKKATKINADKSRTELTAANMGFGYTGGGWNLCFGL